MVDLEIADSKAGSGTNFHNRFYFLKKNQILYEMCLVLQTGVSCCEHMASLS
jgi:hypothetical protein